MSQFKAQAHMRELKQRLQLQMAGASFTDALDANGNPSMKVVSAGGEKCWIHIEALDNAGRVDGLGLAQRSYSPHKVQLLRETAAVEVAARELEVAACAKLGMRMEIWQEAVLPASFDLSAATMIVAIKADEINPLTSSQ